MRGKVILIFPFDLLSHYLRCIRLAENYGNHTVLFAASDKYSCYITQAGYSTFDVDRFDADKVMRCAEKFDFSWLNVGDIERVYLSQVKVIAQLKPDLVIGDTSPTLKMAAEATNVKYIALMNGYMTRYYNETRMLSRTHPGYEHLKKLPPRIADKIISFAEWISFRMVHKPFKKLRHKYQLKYVGGYLSEMEGDENLVCDDDRLFPQKELPPNYKIIGPLLFNTTDDEQELLASLDNTRPTICVCMGSSGNWKKLRFLSGEKYYNLNIVTAGDIDGIITGPHVRRKAFVNLDKVLPLCSRLICHGGNGTIYKGLEHKVFMLCLTSHFEQEWNVQMLEREGLGISINERTMEMVDLYTLHG